MTEQVKPPNCVLIVGCGDIGRRVARLYQSQQVHITGVVQSQQSAEALNTLGIHPLMLDLDSDNAGIYMHSCTVYYLLPPPAKGIEDTRMQRFLASLEVDNRPEALVYLSTTGVYGDCGGDIVTEQSVPNPSVDRARRRYDAEQQLYKALKEFDFKLNILRVGGIYGPDRLPLARIRNQVPMVHEHLAPATNRIHEDDLASICVAAAEKGKPGEVYNVSDGTESNMTEYFLTLADHFKLPRPPLVDWDEAEKTLSKGMLSYLRESRRVSNKKMLQELGVTLKYPDLKTGLAAIKK